MRVILFLSLFSFLSVASGQRIDDVTRNSLGNAGLSESRDANNPGRTLSQREFSQLYEREVIRPAVEQGGLLGGAIALNLQTGEISICKRAPEPSALSLMVAGGLAILFMNPKRS